MNRYYATAGMKAGCMALGKTATFFVRHTAGEEHTATVALLSQRMLESLGERVIMVWFCL